MHEYSETDLEPCASVPTKEEKSWSRDGFMENCSDTIVPMERSAGARRNFARRTSRTLRWPDLRVCGPVGN